MSSVFQTFLDRLPSQFICPRLRLKALNPKSQRSMWRSRMFSKQAATHLPPHRPWDCAIELRSVYNLVRIRAGGLYHTHGALRVPGTRPNIASIFSTAPLLHHPDPKRPFIVEVDTSTVRVGAVLSQGVSESSLLHPCASFSRKLSPAEQNYDVGNRELLAIKLALEEWRHWLEGATPPFTIITDHKNLQYLREAKHSPSEPEPIIPSDLIVSPIIWDMDREIQQATLQEPALPECPEGKIYVPRSQCQPLLGTAHQSPGSGHPGSRRTLSRLHTRYWWPSMHRDTI
ncbi:hypothetical protein M9458_012659, partial [Cirrhinus mrigala]